MIQHLNLLPYEYRQRGLWRRRCKLWALIWMAVAMGMGGLYGASYAAMKSQRDEMLELEAACEPLRSLEADSLSIAKELADLSGRKSLLAKLDRGEQPVQLMGLLSDAVRRVDQGVVISDLLVEPFRVEEAYSEIDAQGQEKKLVRQLDRFRLRLSAFGSDDLAVAHFVSVLKDSAVFESVTLISTGEQTQRAGLREFIVECVFE
jgi:hypothetical protein